MYENTFQLVDRPFRMAPQSDCYVPVECAENARANLVRAIERAEGSGLLIGQPGIGKSLVCQLIARQFRNVFQVALLTSAQLCSRRTLLQTILFELGLPYRDMPEGELRLSLMDHLEPGPNCPNGLLLIIDEAHLLPKQLLEEIRVMTNFVRNGEPRVRLVLAGNRQLEERLADADLEAFSQRVAARCYLQPLGLEETHTYINEHFDRVGGTASRVFTDDAIHAIYQTSDGVPRLINQLCDHALVLADAGGRANVTAVGVHEAWADLQQLPSQTGHDEMFVSTDNEQEGATVIEFGSLTDDDAADEPEVENEGVLLGQLDVEEPAAESISSADIDSKLDHITHQIEEASNVDEVVLPAFAMNDQFDVEPLVAHPFIQIDIDEPANSQDSEYEEEEIVIDHYATIDAKKISSAPVVTSVESREIAAALLLIQTTKTVVTTEAEDVEQPIELRFDPADDPVMPEPSLDMPVEKSVIEHLEIQHDDRDIILVEDEDGTAVRRTIHVDQPRRQEYKQLFAKLRRG